MSITRGESIAQVQKDIVEELRHVIVPVAIPAGDITGQTTEVKTAIFKALRTCYVKGAKLISSAALAANDTNYISVTLKVLTTGMAATPKTTKATGGEAIVAETPWDITVDQNTDLAADDILLLSLTPSTNSVANDLADLRVQVEISYVDVDTE